MVTLTHLSNKARLTHSLALVSGVVTIALFIVTLSCSGWGERFAEEELWRADRVTWRDVQPIFEAQCTSCHGDPLRLGAPIQLTTYDTVTPWLEQVKGRVYVSGDMPPGGLRGEEPSTLLLKWLEAGGPLGEEPLGGADAEPGAVEALNGGRDMDEDSISPPPISSTWTAHIEPLFQMYCVSCHDDPPTRGAPFPLVTYAHSMPHLDRFQERVLQRGDMPPEGISNREHLALIQDWIDQGAPLE